MCVTDCHEELRVGNEREVVALGGEGTEMLRQPLGWRKEALCEIVLDEREENRVRLVGNEVALGRRQRQLERVGSPFHQAIGRGHVVRERSKRVEVLRAVNAATQQQLDAVLNATGNQRSKSYSHFSDPPSTGFSTQDTPRRHST